MKFLEVDSSTIATSARMVDQSHVGTATTLLLLYRLTEEKLKTLGNARRGNCMVCLPFIGY